MGTVGRIARSALTVPASLILGAASGALLATALRLAATGSLAHSLAVLGTSVGLALAQASQAVFGVAIASLSALTDVLIVLAEAVCACVGFAWVHGTTLVGALPSFAAWLWAGVLSSHLVAAGSDLAQVAADGLDTLVGAIRHLATVLAPSIAQAVGSGGATMQSLLGSLSAATTSASTVAAGMPAAFSDLATAAGGLAVAAGGLAAALLSGLMGLLVGMATAGARLLGGATVQLGAGIGAGAATVSAGATNAATSVGVSASQAATSIGASASQAGPAVGGVVTSAGGTIGMVASGIVAKVCALWTSLVGVASLLCLAILATFSSQLAAAGSGLASAVDAAHGAAAAGAGAVVSGASTSFVYRAMCSAMAPVAKLYGLGLLGAASLTVALSLVALCRESLIKMLKPRLDPDASMPKTGTLRVANERPDSSESYTVVEFQGRVYRKWSLRWMLAPLLRLLEMIRHEEERSAAWRRQALLRRQGGSSYAQPVAAPYAPQAPPPNYSTPNPRAPPSGVSPRGAPLPSPPPPTAQRAQPDVPSARAPVQPPARPFLGRPAVREQLSARPQNPSPISNPFFGRARAPQLPSGWRAFRDGSGREYYVETSTGRWTSELPGGGTSSGQEVAPPTAQWSRPAPSAGVSFGRAKRDRPAQEQRPDANPSPSSGFGPNAMRKRQQ